MSHNELNPRKYIDARFAATARLRIGPNTKAMARSTSTAVFIWSLSLLRSQCYYRTISFDLHGLYWYRFNVINMLMTVAVVQRWDLLQSGSSIS